MISLRHGRNSLVIVSKKPCPRGSGRYEHVEGVFAHHPPHLDFHQTADNDQGRPVVRSGVLEAGVRERLNQVVRADITRAAINQQAKRSNFSSCVLKVRTRFSAVTLNSSCGPRAENSHAQDASLFLKGEIEQSKILPAEQVAPRREGALNCPRIIVELAMSYNDAGADFVDTMNIEGIHAVGPVAQGLSSGELIRFGFEGDGQCRQNRWAMLYLDEHPTSASGNYPMSCRASGGRATISA